MKIQGKIYRVLYPKLQFSTFEKNGLLIKTSEKTIFAEGIAPAYKVGTEIVLEGEFKPNPKFGGDKFVFETSSILIDDGKRGKIKFLELVAGEKTAQNMIEEKGLDTAIEAVKSGDPMKLICFTGIGKKKAQKIIKKYNANFKISELLEELKGLGLSITDARNILAELPEQPAEKIRNNPYLLCNLVRISFERADVIAQQLGFDLGDKRRYSSSLIQVVRNELNNGNVYTNQSVVIRKAMEMLSVPSKDFFPDKEDVLDVLKILITRGVFSLVNEDLFFSEVNAERLEIKKFLLASLDALSTYDIDEADIKEWIRAYEAEKTLQMGFPYVLGREQKLAVANSLTHRISIITGGPGTGKTTVADCVKWCVINKIGIRANKIACAAPTAKAAKRLNESTGLPASTIHLLLKVSPESMSSRHKKTEFIFNENNKLNYDFILLDETSMIDFSLASSLMKAIKPTTRVVFLGDIDQLPPVGYGYTLRDLIDGGMPCVKLNEVHRQKGDSTIIPLSQMIKFDKMNDIPKAKDFAFCTLKGTEQIVSIFKRGLENLQSRKVESPLDQIVVLTPQNGEDYGTKNLNKLIQNVVLPETDQQVTHNGIEYRVGSKVMQTSNDNELGVANGEIGYVTKIDFEEKTVTIDFDGHEYEYDGDMLDNVQLGYAMTIHKSQGSEWKYVIEICSHTSRMNTRSLVYTGVTRTRERLIILGDLETFKNCPKNLGQTRRSYVIEPAQTI